MAQFTARLFTADDLWAMGEDARYEIDEGVLVPMSPCGFDHGEVSVNVAALLRGYVRRRRLGRVVGNEAGFRLSQGPDVLRAPDVAFVSEQRLAQVYRGPGFAEGAPDLAVEVVADDDRAAEVERKALQFIAAGVRSVWVLYPRTRTVSVRRADGRVLHLTGEGAVLEDDPALPGFRCRLAELFDGPEE